MSMIAVENLTFSYPSSYDAVFERVNFRIDTDWRTGFIGRNGKGKTTFLKLLLGQYEYEGSIVSSVPFDYFPYPVADPERQTEEVVRELCPSAAEWEVVRELAYLDVDGEVLRRPFGTLSQGERTKVLLAALFLKEGNFLLIDEPTNHLDLPARERVAAYLKKKRGFLLVSHDRSFLDGCVDHILSLNRADIAVRNGNFSAYMEEFRRRQASEAADSERLKKEIHRLTESAERAARWSARTEASKRGAFDKGYVGHKAAKMMKRSKAVETRRKEAVAQKSVLLKNAEKAEDLQLFPLSHHAETLVSFSDTAVFYHGRRVCGPVSFTLRRGERIALDGKNGSGKSSLLKLLLGASVEHTGAVELASGLVISYVPQDTAHLHGTLTAFAEEHHIEEHRFKAILRKMDFTRTQFEKEIEDFSDGQKKKVLLAKSLCEHAHLYVWDEPLNFIDIYTRMQVEELLQAFSPTMIFVEHDRTFRDAIATKIIRL